MSELKRRLDRLDGGPPRQGGVYVVRTDAQERRARENAAAQGDRTPDHLATDPRLGSSPSLDACRRLATGGGHPQWPREHPVGLQPSGYAWPRLWHAPPGPAMPWSGPMIIWCRTSPVSPGARAFDRAGRVADLRPPHGSRASSTSRPRLIDLGAEHPPVASTLKAESARADDTYGTQRQNVPDGTVGKARYALSPFPRRNAPQRPCGKR
jgi:hypothetical protein